jgi:hypothetical protein
VAAGRRSDGMALFARLVTLPASSAPMRRLYPLRLKIGFAPEMRTFGSVSLSVAGYNYNSDWTPLSAGLSPAGMAASPVVARILQLISGPADRWDVKRDPQGNRCVFG